MKIVQQFENQQTDPINLSFLKVVKKHQHAKFEAIPPCSLW